MNDKYRRIDGWRQDRKFRDLGGRKIDKGSGKDGGGFCLVVLVAAGLSLSGLAGAVVGRWPS